MTFDDTASGLPDPDQHPDLYADTTMKRFFAWCVDAVVILLLSLIAIPLTLFVGLFFFALLVPVVAFVYRVVSLANWSATPGMRLMAIELRARDGGRMDLGISIFHVGLYMIMVSVVVLQAASIILMMTGARGQGLHDHLLGTAVLNKSSQP
jgi:uncharacterized RDD family membrane protein YckC